MRLRGLACYNSSHAPHRVNPLSGSFYRWGFFFLLMSNNRSTRQSLPVPQNFAKQFHDENSLVQQLLDRGLICFDVSVLCSILRTIGYYRLTGYLYPFRKSNDEAYEDGTTLEKIWRIYSFDRRLRLCVMDALARIEVAFRAKVMQYHSAFCNGDPFAYCDPTAMPGLRGSRFSEFLDAMDKAINQAASANDPAVIHHNQLYGRSKVPVWVLMENLSFGDVGKYYEALPPLVQQQVANEFGIWPGAFRGWVNLLRRVRNICAHQGRLWNRKINMSISYSFGNSQSLADLYACVSIQSALRYTTLFTALSLCAWMLKSIRPESKWKERVKKLLDDYSDISLADMGFPSNWRQLRLWQ